MNSTQEAHILTSGPQCEQNTIRNMSHDGLQRLNEAPQGVQ